MKLLITGAYGQLGNELKSMLESGRAEIGPIDPSYQHAEVVYRDMDTVDFSDMEKARACLYTVKPDVVINCAAITNVNACETELDAAMKANAILPMNLAVLCQELGAKLVHTSTDYVFAGDEPTPRKEWDHTAPVTAYGKSKELGETLVRQCCTKSFIVRTAWLYGYVGNNFVKTMCRLARENGKVKVVNDQFGNPTSANDLAYHILKLAQTTNYGTYHCTNEGTCSWYDFTKKIMEFYQVPCEVTPCTTEEYPTPAKRPAYSSLDNAMLRNTVGNEMRTWEDALKMYMENAKQRGIFA